MRNTLMISSLLALSLGVAGAQTTAPTTATPTAQVTLSDVPAGHWAKDAVDKIVSCGLIQGFPDGTFRGKDNLTRYQAALIFNRLLTTDALSKCGFSGGDMTTIVNGMQEVSTELAAISTRTGDLEKANSDQEARIAALEARIAGLDSGVAGTDTAALSARVTALEEAIKNIPAGPKGDKGDKGDAATGTVAAPVTATPVTNTGTTVIIGNDVNPMIPAAKNYYAGLTVGAQFTDKDGNPCNTKNDGTGDATSYCVTAGGVIGAKNVYGPFGARIAAEYQPGHKAISGDIAATYNLDLGTNFGVYAGLGAGVTSSPSFNRGTNFKSLENDKVSDFYGLGLLGVEYMATDSLGVFVEGNGRYYFSNKGYGTNRVGTTDDTDKGFNGSVKAGVKFYF